MPKQPTPAQNLWRNSKWANLGNGNFATPLTQEEWPAFMRWQLENDVPYDPSPTSDYDMTGFWKALMSGDPVATTGVNPNDGQMHFTDYFKTPFHRSFSRESKFAKENAPVWNDRDQLVDAQGRIIFDERNP